MTIKDFIFVLAFVAGCVYLAAFYDNPAPDPKPQKSALKLNCLGHEFPNDCRVQFKDPK